MICKFYICNVKTYTDGEIKLLFYVPNDFYLNHRHQRYVCNHNLYHNHFATPETANLKYNSHISYLKPSPPFYRNNKINHDKLWRYRNKDYHNHGQDLFLFPSIFKIYGKLGSTPLLKFMVPSGSSI